MLFSICYGVPKDMVEFGMIPEQKIAFGPGILDILHRVNQKNENDDIEKINTYILLFIGLFLVQIIVVLLVVLTAVKRLKNKTN